MKVARTTRSETAGRKSRSPNPEAIQQDWVTKHLKPRKTGSSLLSRLPDELLVAVFNSVDDIESLKNLCLATQGDVRLYETALERRWKQVVIDDRDLIPAPGDDEKEFNRLNRKLLKKGIGKSWKPVGENVRELLVEVKPDYYAANYVQELTIDLRMLRYWTRDFEMSTLSAHDFFPSLVSLNNTLTLLAPHLKNVQSVECQGDLPQELLDVILALDTVKIRSLYLRSYDGGGKLRDNLLITPEMRPLRRLPLKLDELAVLDQLRTLSIHHLTTYEVPSLLLLLPKLIRLESLSLADEIIQHHGVSQFSKCAIQTLLTSILADPENSESINLEEHEKPSIFPSSLKSLTLWDNGSWQSCPELEASTTFTLETSVTDVQLYLHGLDYATKLISSFPKPQLRNLTVSGGIRPWTTPHSFKEIHNVVTDHTSTLERVQLLQAWEIDPELINGFNERWSNQYSIQELVLGEMNESWGSQSPVIPILTRYLTLDGSGVAVGGRPWGNELRRIRIDNINLMDLDVTALNNPSYSKLRIIMLQPFCQKKIDFQLSELTTDEALKLATDILEHADPALKVVIIQSHWFYIFPVSTGTRTIYRWKDAVLDLAQRKSMQHLLSDADWTFMKRPVPLFWNERQHHNQTMQRAPTAHNSSKFEYEYCYNYMSVLRQ